MNLPRVQTRSTPANNPDAKTLWVGDIETWMDEASLANIFARTGSVANVKVIRDKKTGLSLGYGFVEFTNHKAAQEVLISLNGSTVPGTNKKLKLNWGVMSTSNKTAQPTTQPTVVPNANLSKPTPAQTQSQQQGPEHSIYVGELSQSVDENVLVEFFSQRYRSITGAKIIVDPVTRQSKGYGFVKFSDPQEAQSAIREMQGILLRGRAIKTNQAHIKASSTDNNNANNLNQNLMLNPLLASLTAGGMPNAYGMMGTDNLAMANYAAQQNLQNAQMYQANFLGMQNMAMMPNLQGLQTLQANQALVNPALGYPNLLAMQQGQQGLLQNMQQGAGLNAMQPNQAFSNFNYGSNLAGNMNTQNQQLFQQQQQQQQAYQQPQVMGAYNPQGTISGYGNPQQGVVQMSPQQNPYYAQQGMQGMMYQPQQQLQQQQYGYGIQVQTIPSQQQQQQQSQLYQGMPVQQQNGNGSYQFQPTTPQKQQPLISPTQLNQRFPSQQGQGQKPVQQSPKNQNIGNSPLINNNKNVNTLLPSGNKPFGDGINAIIPGLNIESVPQANGHKMEEEKEEDSMVFNPGFIETNFRFDFISSEKMTNIL